MPTSPVTISPKLIDRFTTYFYKADISQEVDLSRLWEGISSMCDEIGNYTTYHHQGATNHDKFYAISGMRELRDKILAHAIAYSKAINLKITEDSKVSMWASRYRAGDQHEYHNHPNSLVAGTFFVHTDEDSSETIFQDPAMPLRMFDRPVDSDTRHKYDNHTPHYNTWETVPTSGTMLMWPAYILHRVRQQKKGERVTISFNVDP
jgi:uncharacterized protein (TIGR02466 family)